MLCLDRKDRRCIMSLQFVEGYTLGSFEDPYNSQKFHNQCIAVCKEDYIRSSYIDHKRNNSVSRIFSLCTFCIRKSIYLARSISY
jgi:hypothetical protein